MTTSRGAVAGAGGVRVDPLRSRLDRERFVRFPWRVYRGDDAWVPPLRGDVRKVMRDSHPFHRHADSEYFLARRDGRVTGRIAAVVNHVYNEFHSTRTGFIGLFEAIDDDATARALLDTAAHWLRDRGMERVMGPFNLSTNDELYSPGILLDNHGRPPVLLMGHNPPFYRRLFESAGWEKEKDLLAYWLERDDVPERLLRGAERLAGAVDGLAIRQLELRRLAEEVERIKTIYNSAWERNWGFAPLTDAEIEQLARDLGPIVDPRFALIAEVHGRPVGFALALPDYNQALRHLDGTLFPIGFLKLLWHRRRIDRLRVLTLGLTPDYRRRGIDALFVLRIFQDGLAAGFGSAEAAWILEDNWGMRRSLERVGGVAHKTYRVYGRALV